MSVPRLNWNHEKPDFFANRGAMLMSDRASMPNIENIYSAVPLSDRSGPYRDRQVGSLANLSSPLKKPAYSSVSQLPEISRQGGYGAPYSYHKYANSGQIAGSPGLIPSNISYGPYGNSNRPQLINLPVGVSNYYSPQFKGNTYSFPPQNYSHRNYPQSLSPPIYSGSPNVYLPRGNAFNFNNAQYMSPTYPSNRPLIQPSRYSEADFDKRFAQQRKIVDQLITQLYGGTNVPQKQPNMITNTIKHQDPDLRNMARNPAFNRLPQERNQYDRPFNFSNQVQQRGLQAPNGINLQNNPRLGNIRRIDEEQEPVRRPSIVIQKKKTKNIRDKNDDNNQRNLVSLPDHRGDHYSNTNNDLRPRNRLPALNMPDIQDDLRLQLRAHHPPEERGGQNSDLNNDSGQQESSPRKPEEIKDSIPDTNIDRMPTLDVSRIIDKYDRPMRSNTRAPTEGPFTARIKQLNPIEEPEEVFQLNTPKPKTMCKFRRKNGKSKLRIIGWVLTYNFLLAQSVKKKVLLEREEALKSFSDRFNYVIQTLEQYILKAAGQHIQKLVTEKSNSFLFGSKKSPTGSKLDKECKVLAGYFKDILNELTSEAKGLPVDFFIALASVSEEGSHIPNDFFAEFELKRQKFTYFGKLKDMTPLRSKIIIGGIVLRVFVHKIIMKPWDTFKIDVKKINLEKLLNIGSVIYHVMLEVFNNYMPPFPNNQGYLPFELKIRPKKTLPKAIEIDDYEGKIIEQNKANKDEDVIEGFYTREQLMCFFSERKGLTFSRVNELKARVDDWLDQFYQVSHEEALKNPQK